MEEKIRKIVETVFERVNRDSVVPAIINKVVEVDIGDVRPIDLAKLMSDNNIPSYSWFEIKEDQENDLVIRYYESVARNKEDVLKDKIRQFKNLADWMVYKTYVIHGYKRKTVDREVLQEFDDTSVYQMVEKKEFGRIYQYYKMFFDLEKEIEWENQ